MALGEGENFFSREKAERRHRSFLLSPNPSPLFKKSGVFCDCSNLPVWPDTQPLTHPLPVRGTSQGGKAAVFTSSLQSASFATSHPFGGVFCKVESSPLLEIIYPYGEQSLSKKKPQSSNCGQKTWGSILKIKMVPEVGLEPTHSESTRF